MTGGLAGTTSAPWSPTRTTLTPATCELVPGVVLRGANIAPKASHVASGHAYRTLFAEWDWNGWIRPQIDALHRVGANAVRLIGDLEGVNDGTFTHGTYASRWAQLIDYAASLGMFTYPALGGVSQISGGGLNLTQVTTTIATVAGNLHPHKANIVGLDLLQESVRRQVANSWALAFASTITPAVRAVTDIPVTYSNSDAGRDGAARFVFRLWRDVLRGHVDFWDVHIYCRPPRTLLADAFFGAGESKPVLIGEFGTQGVTPEPEKARMFDLIGDVSRFRPGGLKAAGVFAWAVFDQGTGANAHGMFETNGARRRHLTDRFRRLPTR